MLKSFYLLTPLIVLVLFIYDNSYAQYRENLAEELNQQFWLSDIPEFNTIDVPEKWKNESAVILAKISYYQYDKKAFWAAKVYLERKRIKLLDKAAVNTFSEFLIPLEGSIYTGQTGYLSIPNSRFEIKLIKPDGTGKEIDMTVHGVIMNDNLKIAIPDLEPGDIIDYYVSSEYRREAYYSYYFPPVVHPLANQYPIIRQELKIHVVRRAYLNVQALHGAPQLTERKLDDDEIEYFVVDTNREALTPQRWYYITRNFPCVRFQAIVSTKRAADGSFMGESGKAKTSVSEGEILNMLNKNLAHFSKKPKWKEFGDAGYCYAKVGDHLKAKKIPKTDHTAILKEAYYFLRFLEYKKNIDLPPWKMMFSMYNLFKKYNIAFEEIAVPSRDETTIDKLIHTKDIYTSVLIKTSPPVLLHAINNFSMYGESNANFEGQKVYTVDPELKKSKRPLKEYHIPVTTAGQNNFSSEMKVSLTDNSYGLNIERSCNITGAQMHYHQYYLVKPNDYTSEDIERLFTGKELEEQKAWFEENVAVSKSEDEITRLDSLKSKLEKELNGTISDISDFELLQTGRWDDAPELKYKVEFNIEGLVEKAGPNYLVHLGKLIGDQIRLAEKERVRTTDIMLPYSMSFNHTVSFNLPDGYRVKGLEDLKYQVNNETGSFESTAELNGNVLTITTSKVFKHNFEKAADWPKMIEFLDAAYDFSQRKILLESKL